MTELEFTAVEAPEEAEPDVSPGADLHCQVCGKPLEYNGRGRKPKYCSEHRKGPSRSTVKASNAKNERLASQATDALMQINGITAFLAHITGLPATADAITTAEPALREQVHAALITDPDLCALILKGGMQSARVSLVIAYAMFGVAVVPTAIAEVKVKRLAKEAELEGGDGRD